jgi:hypothetical protein
MATGPLPADAGPAETDRRTVRRSLAALALGPDLPIVGVWLALGAGLAALTYRIADWFKVPDEIVFQKLALSIARDHSLVPRIHGEFIRSLSQLYPLLVSPIVSGGYVADDLPQIRVLNAFVVTSACIPAYLLAKRVTGRRSAAYLLAVLSVTLPWLVLAPFLLTEVVALPTFLWALLAMQHAVVRGGVRADLLVLLALVVAFFSRTQFVLLVAVLPLAVVVFEVPRDAGRAWRSRAGATARAVLARHRVLVVAYAGLALVAIGIVLSGRSLLSASIYSDQFTRGLTPTDVPGWALGHVADLAFSMGILPFVVGTAWLLANAIRPAATPELQAFACVGGAAVLVTTYTATTFDLQLGGFIFDRYLFYLVPPVLLAFVCALLDARRPRWSLAVPVAAVAAGFLLHFQAVFTWTDVYDRLNSDTPISIVYRPVVDLAGSRGTAALLLAAATVALAALYVAADALLGRARVAVALICLVAIALPAETAYAFNRLFDRIGYSERPLTESNAGVLDWIDRRVGTDPQVTIAPYPVSSAYLVTEKYWRDVEFWNKSVSRHVLFPDASHYAYTGIWFPKIVLELDPRTGAASASPTRYLVDSVAETRFRIAGTAIEQTREAVLIDAEQPWRAAWRTFGLYADGWTRPGVTARVRLYPDRGQRGAVLHRLNLQLRVPDDVTGNHVTVVAGGERRTVEVNGGDSTFVSGIDVCVPADGFADVPIDARGPATVPGDQTTYADSLGTRSTNVLVAGISVDDETYGRCG